MTLNWKSAMVLVFVFAAGIGVGALQTPAFARAGFVASYAEASTKPVELQAGASGQSQTRREPQFENEHVQVWKSIIMPNQPLALHRHDFGRTIVALKGGTLDIVDAAGKTTKQEKWETGRAYWLGPDPAGQQHGDLNRGKEPIEVMVVQLKK
jgi:hypothetical protein